MTVWGKIKVEIWISFEKMNRLNVEGRTKLFENIPSSSYFDIKLKL